MLPKFLKFSLTVLLQILVASASKWDLKMNLRDLISGHCHVVTPRVCRKFTGFDSDFTCGFILRHVCTNAYTGEQSLKMLTDTDKNIHITPLPRSLSFYDVNEDGHISLNEFARTLGHSPRDLHVKVAFRAADKNGDGTVSFREFQTTDAWVFEANYMGKPHAFHHNQKSKPQRKSVVPHNIHAIKAYIDSDEDESKEHDISSEQIDLFESSEKHENYPDDSEEMYEEMESFENNKHSTETRHLPVSPRVGDSNERSHEVDSREVGDNSREEERSSQEKDEISHEVVEENSHEKEMESHSVEKLSHKVKVISHKIKPESHEMESVEEESDSREDFQDSHENDDVSKEVKNLPFHHRGFPRKTIFKKDSLEERNSIEYKDSEEDAEYDHYDEDEYKDSEEEAEYNDSIEDKYEDSEEEAEYNDSKEDEYKDSEEEAEYNDSKEDEYEDSEEEAEYKESIEVEPSHEVSDHIDSGSEEDYDEDSRESKEDKSHKKLKKVGVKYRKTSLPKRQ